MKKPRRKLLAATGLANQEFRRLCGILQGPKKLSVSFFELIYLRDINVAPKDVFPVRSAKDLEVKFAGHPSAYLPQRTWPVEVG